MASCDVRWCNNWCIGALHHMHHAATNRRSKVMVGTTEDQLGMGTISMSRTPPQALRLSQGTRQHRFLVATQVDYIRSTDTGCVDS